MARLMARRGPNAKRLIGAGLNKAHSLTDDFRTLDTAKWPTRTGASVVGWWGRLTLPAPGSPAVFSTDPNRYDLTNSSVYVEFATLPTFNTSSTYLMARNSFSPENQVFIGREGANLLMREVAAGVVSDTTLTYDYTFHRWVRLRHDGTNLLWETSNNGTTWTTRRSKVTTVTLSSVIISIESQWQVSAGVGFTEVAWLNSPPVTALTYTPPPMHFGTLRTINDSSTTQSDDEYAGGCRIHMYEVFWDRAEPTTNGTFSSSYATEIVSHRNTMQATGGKITLALGTYAPPAWTSSIANRLYVDQAGNNSTQLNYVFNQLVRTEAEHYLTWINDNFGFANCWAIRLTSGGDGEALYPGATGFWAYDTNAQTGAPNLPTTVAPCPYPGWRPGETTITTAQVRDWVEWYIKSLVDSVNWQMRFIRGLGFTGWFEILTPGNGTRPSVYETDIANRLSPITNTTGRGAVWHKFYESLVDRHGVVAYCSSVADNSGSPANDVPTAADVNTAINNTAANNWSAARWIVRLGNEYGLPNGGENPGWGGVADSYYQDTTSSGLLRKSADQAVGGKYLSFYWAHSDKLWDGTLPFSNYSSRIAAINTTGAGTPPNPP